MKARIQRELIQLLSTNTFHYLEGIEHLAAAFRSENTVEKNTAIWEPSTIVENLYFNTEGVLGEFLETAKGSVCIRIIPPFSFFWSEQSFLLWKPSDTSMICLKKSWIYSLKGEDLRAITSTYGLGFQLANTLSLEHVRQYRERNRSLSALNSKQRIEAALLANPKVLEQLSRKELASYVGISRSSLFRVLKELQRGS